jgi:hypothetical protein
MRKREGTMIELTEIQRQALAEADSPPEIVDPTTQEKYVLIRRDLYERLKSLLEEDVRLMEPLLAELDPEDWEDASAYEGKP